MDDLDETPGVRVTVRLRPLNTKELGEGQTVGWQYNNKTILDNTGQGKKSYNYDSVLGPNSTNDQAYTDIAAHLVEKSLNGYNTTVFAYGQTGSGKTWTMMGDDDGKYPGIIPRALDSMFQKISADKDRNYLLRCSFLELYNETINDLLNEDGTGQNLAIVADDPAKGAIIGGLREEIIGSVADGMSLIDLGNENRKVASTAMNARSSRSHTIFRVVLEATKTEEALERERKLIASFEEVDEGEGDASSFKSFGTAAKGTNTVVSYLNLVDLAGSERQGHTKAEGKQLKEGAAINKSLLALGAVIGALSEGLSHGQKSDDTSSGGGGANPKDGKKKKSAVRLRGRRSAKKGRSVGGGAKAHIPYRNSKLTRILRQSLGGNTFTSIVIAMSPAPMYREESRSSLKFGRMCKKIKNKVRQNAVADDKTLLKQYKLQIARLKLKLEEEHEAAAAVGVGSAAHPAGSEEAFASQKAAEEETQALRKKLSILQTMYLGGGGGGGGGSSKLATDSKAPAASKFWSKLKSGVKSKFLVDERNKPGRSGRLHRRQSFHVTSGSKPSNFQLNMMTSLRHAEDFVHSRSNSMTELLRTPSGSNAGNPLGAEDASFYTSKIERLEKELTAMQEQKGSEDERLAECLRESAEANVKRQEVEFQLKEAASKATIAESRAADLEMRIQQLEVKNAAFDDSVKAGAIQVDKLTEAIRKGEAQIEVSRVFLVDGYSG